MPFRLVIHRISFTQFLKVIWSHILRNHHWLRISTICHNTFVLVYYHSYRACTDSFYFPIFFTGFFYVKFVKLILKLKMKIDQSVFYQLNFIIFVFMELNAIRYIFLKIFWCIYWAKLRKLRSAMTIKNRNNKSVQLRNVKMFYCVLNWIVGAILDILKTLLMLIKRRLLSFTGFWIVFELRTVWLILKYLLKM